MPLGTAILPSGIRFRLWAPAARDVKLCLYSRKGTRHLIPMVELDEKHFSVTTDAAEVGTRYHFLVDDNLLVPDPASRCQADDVHGPSEVIDPLAYEWRDDSWRTPDWHNTILYELHVGAFTAEGTFSAIAGKLDHLAHLGVTAIELMPVADFPGRWNWGYDGVLPFAPDRSYGRPEDLKRLVDEAHQRGFMVFLDVVYNHFGPEGNYLWVYAKPFFTDRYDTPWGSAIDFSIPDVRQFFVHNVLYWLEEYSIDGLRLDAVHAINDDSRMHILEEIALAVSDGPGQKRNIHLVLENDDNCAGFIERTDRSCPRFYVAQWNDDFHHAAHVLLTGEQSGYYADYSEQTFGLPPIEHLGRCLTQGFSYQGEQSPYRNGRARGECSRHLPPAAFVNFLQNHDQVGNRALGERISLLAGDEALKAAVAVLLLAPSPPLLFMGEEWQTTRHFCLFCDLGPDLAPKVKEGRQREFAGFPEFSLLRDRIPDPCAETTFTSCRLDWSALDKVEHRGWFAYYSRLLELRKRWIIPRLPSIGGNKSTYNVLLERLLTARWQVGPGETLVLAANLSPNSLAVGADFTEVSPEAGVIFQTAADTLRCFREGIALPWSVAWLVEAEVREVAGHS